MDQRNSFLLPKKPQHSSIVQVPKTQIELWTNMFPLFVEKAPSSSDHEHDEQPSSKTIAVQSCYTYNVEFEPKIENDNRYLKKKIFRAACKNIENIIGKFSFNGNNLYVIKQISNKKVSDIKNIDAICIDGVSYSIQINLVNTNKIENDDLICSQKCENDNSSQLSLQNTKKSGNRVIQCLNSIVKSILRDDEGLKEIGKYSKFYEKEPVSGGFKNYNKIDIFKGISLSINSTHDKKCFLNIDFAAKLFRQETALEYFQQNGDNIVGQSVTTSYNNYQIYQIEKVERSKNPQSTFFCKRTNSEISYVEYYKTRYNKQIKDQNQPLLISLRKCHDVLTNSKKQEEIFLIPEICRMTGITEQQRKNKGLMKEIANHTKPNPQQRYDYSVKYCQLLSKRSQSSGIQIDHTQNTIKAYQIKPPTIYLGDKKELNKTAVNFDIKGPLLDQKIEFSDWSIIYHKDDEKEVDTFFQDLVKAAQVFNIQITEPYYFAENTMNFKNWQKTLDKDFEQNDLPYFVLTMGNIQPKFYQEMKKFLTFNACVESQHVRFDSLEKNRMSICSKIALQIAAKLKKRLWKVESASEISLHTMIIGIETSRKKVDKRQVIGVVATLNSDFTSYYSHVEFRNQDDRILTDLKGIIEKVIQAYNKNNKVFPENIIIYREGVGEAQIEKCMQIEIEAIKQLIKKLHENNNLFNPKLAFFAVNKKIGQKFYQKSSQSGSVMCNPSSGTIVNSQFTEYPFEFFLISQNCRIGVCTPTKYTCLYDDTKMSQDQFQQLTYFQTFNYYNWQGPIRVPAVMKYAEKLAQFVSNYIQQKPQEQIAKSLYYL